MQHDHLPVLTDGLRRRPLPVASRGRVTLGTYLVTRSGQPLRRFVTFRKCSRTRT